MKFLFDYFPIICFFLAYKLQGIYYATAATMIACVLQNAIYWIKHRRFEKMHLITLLFVLILGSFTLLFHNEIFIKWKPSVIYWIFSSVLLYSQFFGTRSLMERMLGDKIALPQSVWYRINIIWIVFFLLMGFLNLYVIYNFDTNTWVNFKLFGTLGLTILPIAFQAVYMARHMQTDDKITSQK